VSEPAAGGLPSLAEARGWSGLALDDAGGRTVGRVEGAYADAESGGPVWLVVALGQGRLRRFWPRRRGTTAVVVPLRECAAMPGRVWTAQSREAIRAAPTVDPGRPLLREHEAAICAHYGIGASIGRHAELAGRPEGAVTSV
jgi:hypothetical protein